MGAPKWFGKEEPTRKASEKQEKRIAKEFKGRKTANSGASFGENDIKTPKFDIEAKTTKSTQYILKMAELRQMERKADKDKIPLFIIEFAQENREFIIISKEDFMGLSGNTDLRE